MTQQTRREVLAKTVAVFAATAIGSRPGYTAQNPGDPTAHVVEIRGFKFVPATLSVHEGDTITWINRELAPHTATARDKSWDTGPLKKDESKTVKVLADMSPDYICKFHPMMKGKLLVEN